MMKYQYILTTSVGFASAMMRSTSSRVLRSDVQHLTPFDSDDEVSVPPKPLGRSKSMPTREKSSVGLPVRKKRRLGEGGLRRHESMPRNMMPVTESTNPSDEMFFSIPLDNANEVSGEGVANTGRIGAEPLNYDDYILGRAFDAAFSWGLEKFKAGFGRLHAYTTPTYMQPSTTGRGRAQIEAAHDDSSDGANEFDYELFKQQRQAAEESVKKAALETAAPQHGQGNNGNANGAGHELPNAEEQAVENESAQEGQQDRIGHSKLPNSQGLAAGQKSATEANQDSSSGDDSSDGLNDLSAGPNAEDARGNPPEDGKGDSSASKS